MNGLFSSWRVGLGLGTGSAGMAFAVNSASGFNTGGAYGTGDVEQYIAEAVAQAAAAREAVFSSMTSVPLGPTAANAFASRRDLRQESRAKMNVASAPRNKPMPAPIAALTPR